MGRRSGSWSWLGWLVFAALLGVYALCFAGESDREPDTTDHPLLRGHQ